MSAAMKRNSDHLDGKVRSSKRARISNLRKYRFQDELVYTAQAIAAPGKGLLASDERLANIQGKFKKIGLECTAETRRLYRELLYTTKGWEKYCSGVIMNSEILPQSCKDGQSFVDVCREKGVIVGIKCDQGVRDKPFYPGQVYAIGMTDLDKRAAEYYKLGARFAKWRCVLKIQNGVIPEAVVNDAAQNLAQYAAICQDNGLVPIVEPEILMDGEHDLKTNQYWTERTLIAIYKAMIDNRVLLEGSLLKCNMCLPGKFWKGKLDFSANALATVTCLRRACSAAVPGVVFLSGGQSENEATKNLNAINELGPQPWALSFSFGRALQISCLDSWKGKKENWEAAQKMFLERAQANSEACHGKYTGWATSKTADKSLFEKGYKY